MKKPLWNKTLVIFILSFTVLVTSVVLFPSVTAALFDENQAFYYLEQQLSFGPRTPGSEGHSKFVDWATAELTNSGWEVLHHSGLLSNKYEFTNILAQRDDGGEDKPWIILGAHYDTRFFADSDPDPANRTQPVPGANDGASGVAVLMELASALPKTLDKNLWIVLFDAEDQGRISGWEDWCLGSAALAEEIATSERKPDAVVIVDMIGDKNLEIYRESNSTPALVDEIWAVAAKEGYGHIFIDQEKYRILDDHVPFLEAGIPAADLIDFDYPAWHTLSDDVSNVSKESLAIVGNVLYSWLTGK